MKFFMVLIYLLVIIVGVAFTVLNAADVTVNYFFDEVKMPLALLIAILLGLGVFVGLMVGFFRYWRLRLAYHEVAHQLKRAEKEIQNLRVMPLRDPH